MIRPIPNGFFVSCGVRLRPLGSGRFGGGHGSPGSGFGQALSGMNLADLPFKVQETVQGKKAARSPFFVVIKPLEGF